MKDEDILISIVAFQNDFIRDQSREINELKFKNEGLAKLCKEAVDLAKLQNERTKVNMN